MADVDFVEFLQDQGRSWAAALHKFRLAVSKDDRSVHAFFEGDEDRLFYMAEIRRCFPDFWVTPYNCNGKSGVLRVRAQINSDGYDTSRTMFFIDRDFDDYLDCQAKLDKCTYLTDTYSIENHLTCPQVVQLIVIDFSGLSATDPEFSDATSSWEKEYDQFVRAMRPLMAWSIAAREIGVRPNYNNVNLVNVVSFENGQWRRKPGGYKAYAQHSVPDAQKVGEIKIRTWLAVLSAEDPSKWLRGKFAFWFLQAFIRRWCGRVDWKKKGRRKPSGIMDGNLFSFIGGRYMPPASLVSFLADRIAAIAEQKG